MKVRLGHSSSLSKLISPSLRSSLGPRSGTGPCFCFFACQVENGRPSLCCNDVLLFCSVEYGGVLFQACPIVQCRMRGSRELEEQLSKAGS